MSLLGIYNQNTPILGVPIYQSSRLLADGQTVEITFDNPATYQTSLPTDVNLLPNGRIYGMINPLGLLPKFVARPEKSSAVLDISWAPNDTTWGNSFGSTGTFSNQSVTNQSTFTGVWTEVTTTSPPTFSGNTKLSRVFSGNLFIYTAFVDAGAQYEVYLIEFDDTTNTWSTISTTPLVLSKPNTYAVCGLSSTSINGYLVVTVIDEANTEARAYEYDSNLDTWNLLGSAFALPGTLSKPTSSPYYVSSIAVFDSGTSDLRNLDFDTNTNTWTSLGTTTVAGASGSNAVISFCPVPGSAGVLYHDDVNNELRIYYDTPFTQLGSSFSLTPTGTLSLCSLSEWDFVVVDSGDSNVYSYRLADDQSAISLFSTTATATPLIAVENQSTLSVVGKHRAALIDTSFTAHIKRWAP